MASFTDILPQFSPYIQELPVEAMVEVGMEKQRRYDEGVQKIQQSIYNIAGLPVLRDQDKVYVQSRLNELGSKLKSVAGGDFSNYQLVNSVSGMTNQIIKDPIIQAAVSSASHDAEQQKFMEEEKKKGNLTPDNEWKYNSARQAYLQAGLTDEAGKPIKFNQQYINHFDVDKFVRESFDAIKPGNYTFEQLYMTDENGKELKDKNGNYIPSKVASVLEQEGRFPEEVKATLNQILNDPRVKQQLQITGEYNYRAYTPEMLTEKFAVTKDQQLQKLNNTLEELNLKKSAGEDVQKNIDKVEEAIQSVNSQFSEISQIIKDNPTAVKGSIYMDEVKNNWTNMYGTIKEKRTFEKNELFAVNFELQKEANDLAIRREDMKYKWASLAETKKKNLEDKQREDLKMKLEYPLAFPEMGPLAPGSLNANAAFDGLYDRAATTYTSAVDDLILSTVLNSEQSRKAVKKYTDAGMSPEAAKARVINNTAKAQGVSPEEYRTAQQTKATTYLEQNPGKLDPDLLTKLNNVQTSQGVFKTLSEAKKKVDEKTPEDYKQLIGKLKPITVSTKGLIGRFYNAIIPDKIKELTGWKDGNITLSPQQQYDLALATSGDKIGNSPAVKAEAKRAQERLAAQGIDKETAETISRGLTGGLSPMEQVAFGSQNPLSFFVKSGVQLASDVNPNSIPYRNLVKAVGDPKAVVNLEKRAQAIADIYEFNPVARVGIFTGKEEVDKVYRENIKRFIGGYSEMGANESPGFLENAPAMVAAINSKDGAVEMEAKKDEVTGEVKQVLKFYDGGKAVGEMTIDQYQSGSLNKNPSGFFTMPGVKIAEMRFNSSGNGTTAGSGAVKDISTYIGNDVLYVKDQFPLLRGQLPSSIDVKANISSTTYIDADGNPSTQYYNHLYINNGGQKMIKTFNVPKPNIDQAVQGLNGVNMQLIQQIIAENKSKK
jgi:hypothetical protein